ncbi:phage tail protein [Weissella muntiaci]|uniref:Phage tail protein n=1 Tax=Weissella muntiaci TaxID=2508881 RepID=A0A6C2C5L6_9LACO|nr:phage tail protein [Weissella muntiaci]TYC48816.1 phage tail protein [Weissella muntiaci]
MARKKNALRKHFIAPYNGGTMPTDADEKVWLPLAANITTISDDSEEKTDTAGDYAGDGNELDILTGRSEKWSYEGTYDPADPAQQLIAGMKRKTTDEERMLWHKVVESDGSTVVGAAKALEIVAGGGDATEFEDFTGHLDFVGTPTITKASDTGAGA